MGTQGLGQVIRQEPLLASDLRGQRIAVDAHNLLYAAFAGFRGSDGMPMTSPEGRVTAHIHGLLKRHEYFVNHGIDAVYVFEPREPHPLKAAEVAKRRAKRDEARKLLEEAKARGDMDAARRLAMQAIYLDSKMLHEARYLLQLLGAPTITAEAEGEAECARLVRDGTVMAAATQDYDAVLFGANLLVRDLAVSKEPQMVIKGKVLDELGLTQQQLVDACILAGTDFHEGVDGIGVKTAIKLVKSHGSIEQVAAAAGGAKATKAHHAIAAALPNLPVEAVRQMFHNCPVSSVAPQPSQPPSPELPGFLEGEFGITTPLHRLTPTLTVAPTAQRRLF